MVNGKQTFQNYFGETNIKLYMYYAYGIVDEIIITNVTELKHKAEY